MAKKSLVPPTEITTWLGKIKMAEDVRKKADREYGYTRAHQQYRGDYVSAVPTFIRGVKMIPINEVYAYCRAFIPSVYSRDPYISVNTRTAQGAQSAKIRELYINAYWRELRLKREVRRIILDAILSEGYIKVGYSNAMGRLVAKDGEPQIEPSEYVKNEEIFATRISWKNMVRDPDATDGLHDARWVAQNIIRPLDAVRASSFYENTKEIQPRYIVSSEDNKQHTSPSGSAEVAYASLWEVWDIDANEVFTISEGSAVYHMKKKWPYDIEGFPYVMLRFNDNPDEPYSPNLIGPWEPQLWEKMKLRAMQLDHIKRFNRQMSVEEGAMTPVEIQKLELGDTGSVTKRKKGYDVPAPIPYPPLQTDIYAIGNSIDMDKDNISGQPNAVRSAPQRTQSRTLGEIDRLMAAFQANQNTPQTLIEEFCEEVAYKILGISAQFMSGKKWIKATKRDVQDIAKAFVDQDGRPRFDGRGFNFTKADIQGIEFDVNVKAGSTLPMNKENRLQVASDLLKLGPTLGVAPNGKVAKVLGKMILGELDMPEVEAAYDEEIKAIENAKVLMRAQQQMQISEAESKLGRLQEKAGDMY